MDKAYNLIDNSNQVQNFQPIMQPLSTRTLLLLTLLMLLSQAYQPCTDISLQGFKFELSALKSKENVMAGAEVVQLSLCGLVGCPPGSGNGIGGNNQSRNGYVLVFKNQVCNSYTANQTGPLLEWYKLLDSQDPKKGLSTQYIPTYSRSKTYRNITITTTDNQTVTYQSSNETNTLNRAQIRLLCLPASQSEKQTSCSKTTNLVSTHTPNNMDYVFNVENTVACDVWAREACPVLAVNSFWIFLIRRAIVFAIVLWVCALFLIVLGYLAIRVTILLYGVFTGAFFGVIFVAEGYQNFYMESDGIFIFIVCLSVLMGLLFGITLLTVPKLGYINIGVFVAALFTLLLQNSVLYLTGSLLAFYITFGVTAFVMSVIALMELRYFIIICSSFTGAFLFIRPLGFFLPGYPNELISGKNFLISVKTPWQFYLYLASIIVLTGIGIAIQKCIDKKVGKNKGSSGHYYLEQEGTVREKLKKIFEFKQIKDMIKAGKKQIVQLKNMITDEKNVSFVENQEEEDSGGHYIEMEKMEKIQNEKGKEVRKEEKAKFWKPKPKNKRKSDQLEPIEAADLQSAQGSQQQQPVKYTRTKNK